MSNNKILDKLILLKDKELTEDDINFARTCLSNQEPLVRMEAVSLICNSDFFNEKDIERLLPLFDDNEMIVRTEVYDGLSDCTDTAIIKKLKHAVYSEKDDIGRSYAIEAWTDTIVYRSSPDYSFDEEINFIKSIQNCDFIQKSKHTRLACEYALYSFKVDGALQCILSFLNIDDHDIQCSVINDLMRILRKDDIPKVSNVLSEFLNQSPYPAVSSLIEEFLNQFVSANSDSI